MSKEEDAIVEWIKSEEGYYHACAFTENALIMGFPQKSRNLWPNFGALIIKRQPVGGEPEIVALENQGDTFKVVKKYDLLNASDCVYDLVVSIFDPFRLPVSSVSGKSGHHSSRNFSTMPFYRKREEGKTLFAALGNEDIEA